MFSISCFSKENSRNELLISPQICVVSESKQVCELTLTIKWFTAENKSVCLLENEIQIQCWQDQNQAIFVHRTQIENQSTYSLVDLQTGIQLMQEQVQVQSSQIKTKRRRLRSPWSFF